MIDANGQELDIAPLAERADAVARQGDEPPDLVAQGWQSSSSDIFGVSFRDDIRALPIIPAVDHHQDPAGIEAAEGLLRIAGPPRQPQPQRIHRRTEFDEVEAGPFAHSRIAPVGPDGQIGVNLQLTLRGAGVNTGDAPAILDRLCDLGLHVQTEGRIAFRLLGEEVNPGCIKLYVRG